MATTAKRIDGGELEAGDYVVYYDSDIGWCVGKMVVETGSNPQRLILVYVSDCEYAEETDYPHVETQEND